MQLRDNWQLGGRNHGWTFLNVTESTQDYLCIEPNGIGYFSEQGDNTCAINGNDAVFYVLFFCRYFYLFFCILALVNDTLVRIIPKFHPEWKIRFEIYPTGTVSGWSNIVHFTIGRNVQYYGSRNPALWFFSETTKAPFLVHTLGCHTPA